MATTSGVEPGNESTGKTAFGWQGSCARDKAKAYVRMPARVPASNLRVRKHM